MIPSDPAPVEMTSWLGQPGMGVPDLTPSLPPRVEMTSTSVSGETVLSITEPETLSPKSLPT
jgi:hypothetical protein